MPLPDGVLSDGDVTDAVFDEEVPGLSSLGAVKNISAPFEVRTSAEDSPPRIRLQPPRLSISTRQSILQIIFFT